jgi:hypothetical protein
MKGHHLNHSVTGFKNNKKAFLSQGRLPNPAKPAGKPLS